MTNAEPSAALLPCPDCGAADQDLHRDGCPRLWWASPRDAALRDELSDAEVDAATGRALTSAIAYTGSDYARTVMRNELRAIYRAGAAREGMDAEAWAELYRLRAESSAPDGFAAWKETAIAERKLVSRLRGRIVALKKEGAARVGIAQDKLDAERYRWLRSTGDHTVYVVVGNDEYPEPERVDAAIDAAREQPPQHDKAPGDTGGAATDGQADAERA